MLHDVTTSRQKTKHKHKVETQKFDRARSDWEISYFGFMGEVGVARALCVDPDWSVHAAGDGGLDLQFGGATFQIKTPLGKSTKDWFYFNDEDRFNCDFGILCNIDSCETAVVIRGVIGKEEFVAQSVTQNFGYGERLAVHADKMHPLDSAILAAQQKHDIEVGEQC